MTDKLWFKDPDYGKLESKARSEGGLGSELKHAAKFTASYWKKKAKGAKEAITIKPRDTLGKNTRSQLEKLDSF